MSVKEVERRRRHHSSSPSISASSSSGSPDADKDHHQRHQRRRRRPSASEMFDDVNEHASSSKQIRVHSRDRGRHRDRERGRDPDHRYRSSTLPDPVHSGLTAADDDGNSDKPWFKKKTLWASVATMVSKVLLVLDSKFSSTLRQRREMGTFSPVTSVAPCFPRLSLVVGTSF